MKASIKNLGQIIVPIESDVLERYWDESWTYIKTVVDIVRQPVLILDKNLRVMDVNENFYQTFFVKPKDTLGKSVYELGNGQWNIPALRKLIEDILPKKTFFKGFEVSHDFPIIGNKVMVLNGRQIHFKHASPELSPIILLVIEDITALMDVAKRLADHTNKFEASLLEKTNKLKIHIEKLEKDIDLLSEKSR